MTSRVITADKEYLAQVALSPNSSRSESATSQYRLPERHLLLSNIIDIIRVTKLGPDRLWIDEDLSRRLSFD